MEKRVVVGMDVGSCKTVAAVAEPMEKGRLRLAGVCAAPTRGMQDGAITSVAELGDTMDNVIQQAETIAGQEIDELHLSFFGAAFRSEEKYAELEITNRLQKVTEDDREEVINKAISLNPPEEESVHRIVKEFILDDNHGIRDPVGMFGQKLGVKIYAVNIRNNIYKALNSCVKNMGINKFTLGYAPFVAAGAVLNQDEVSSGVVYLDVGQSASSLVIYQEALNEIRVFKIGGARFTAALARTIKIHLSEAERIKNEYGTCDRETASQKILVYNSQGEKKEELDRRMLAAIITAEIEGRLIPGIAELKSGKRYAPIAGLVLGGGTARLSGLADFLESRLELPVRVGRVTGFQDGGKELDDPAYHAVLGVIQCNFERHRARNEKASDSETAPEIPGMLARFQRGYSRVRRLWRSIQSIQKKYF